MNARSIGVAGLALAVALGFAAQGARAMGHMEGVRAALESGARQFEAAVAAGDAAALAALYSEEAKVLPPGGETATGRTAIQALWQGFLDTNPGGGVALTIDEVLDGGPDLAVEVGHYSMTDAAGAVIELGKYVAVWRREGDAWRLYRDTWNTTPPASAPAP